MPLAVSLAGRLAAPVAARTRLRSDPAHLRTQVVLVDGAEHQLSLIRAAAAITAEADAAEIIEGARGHVIADHLAVSGSKGGLDGTEAVLTLRAVISNG